MCSYYLLAGFSGNPSGPKDEKKTDDHASSSKSTGSRTLLICIGLIAFAGLSFFLFKIWQRKRREEQYARLLKLFEEDDELEVELGLRD